jgi:Zn-dependent protease
MLFPTIPLGRISGIRIGAHWSVLIVVVLIAQVLAVTVLPSAAPGQRGTAYWTVGAFTAALFVFSLLAHELAHALTARHYGVRVRRVTLWMLGGATEIEDEPPSPRADFMIAAVGPLTSLAIGGLCWLAATALTATLSPLLLGGLIWLALTNAALAVFNLLPGAPLDGGRVLRAALWKRTGDRIRAGASSAKAGRVLGFALVGAGLAEVFLIGQWAGLWLALVGWFLISAASVERASGAVRQGLTGVPVRAVMTADPVVAPEWLTVQGFLDQIAMSARHRTFPVVSFQGAPVGVLDLGTLARLSPQDRLTTRVADVCRTPPRVTVVTSGDPITGVLGRSQARTGKDLVLVADDGRLTGVIAVSDLARVLELVALGQRIPYAAG